MAEKVAPALRAHHELEGESLLCPEEDDWQQMIAVLGNADRQQAVRDQNPEGRHCELLQISPHACVGCKNNPRESSDRAGKKRLVESWQPWIWAAFELHDRHKLSMLDASSLHPAEVNLLLLAWSYREQDREERQARLMALELAKILGKILR